jgi:hypothetical protein
MMSFKLVCADEPSLQRHVVAQQRVGDNALTTVLNSSDSHDVHAIALLSGSGSTYFSRPVIIILRRPVHRQDRPIARSLEGN